MKSLLWAKKSKYFNLRSFKKMANVTRSSTLSFNAFAENHSVKVTGLTAGAAIALGDACYLETDGKVYPARSDKVIGYASKFIGIAPLAYASGDAMTVYGKGARFDYAASMFSGSYLYVSGSGTPGYLADAATVITGTSSLSEKAEGKRQKGPCEAQWDADYGKT